MKVRTEDMIKDIQQKMIALQMVGINIDYPNVELILIGLAAEEKLGDQLTLKDAAEIRTMFSERWENYNYETKPEVKKTEFNEWLAFLIENVDVSIRLLNVLGNNKYNKFENVEDITKNEFMKIKGGGKATWRELEMLLKIYT